MSNDESAKYFDLLSNGIGYLNRVREVTPEAGKPFLSVTIAALRGSADNVRYSYFECVVSGQQARSTVLQLQIAVERNAKVMIGFTLNDLYAEPFTFKSGDKAGELGVNLKARLLRIGWAKVDGHPFDIPKANAA